MSIRTINVQPRRLPPMTIRERERDNGENTSSETHSSGNSLHFEDIESAREQLVQRSKTGEDILKVESSEEFAFAQKFQDEVKRQL